MKLYFCDLCNESVPHQDLEEGKAFLRKGRVVCASCDQAMSNDLSPGGGGSSAVTSAGGAAAALLDPPKSGSARTATHPETKGAESRPRTVQAPVVVSEGSGGGLGLWAGLCALIFSVGAVALLVEKMRVMEAAVPTAVAAGRTASESWTQEQLSSERELAGAQRTLLDNALRDTLRADREALSVQIAGIAESLDAQAAKNKELRAGLAAIEATLKSQNADTALAIDQIGSRFASMEEEQRWLGERLAELEVGLESGAFGGVFGGPALSGMGGDPNAAGGAPGQPAWSGLLAGLTSPNSMLRWEAVDALGETGDVRVAEHLIPMLADPDIFVRMASARKLGDLRSVEAIPFMIDALDDPELAMREAVVSSLRATTGQNFGFSGSASDSERAKRVKSWRSWWSKNEESLRSE